MTGFYFPILHLYISFIISIVGSKTPSSKELQNIFENRLCIEGTINTIFSDDKKAAETNIEAILNLTSTGKVEFEKPVLSKLNELVGFNQIEHFFKLENEEGPPHNKLFTVSLTLGKENYVGKGKSLKKAKQDAATVALKKTEYESPPVKRKTIDDVEKLTPTVLLNNLAAKLGVGVTYFLLDKNKEEILHTNIIMTDKKKSYMQKLNDSIYSDKKIKIKKDIDSTKGPFRIKLKFGEHIFHTTSHSIQSGRHEVASKALEFVIKNQDNLDIACLNEGSEAKCKLNKQQLKSPISKVYEEAQKRKLEIEFELVKESGPSHKKTFTTECRLGEIVTVGEGSSKKESKREAAISMLEKISEMEPLPPEVEVENFNNNGKKGKKRNKKNKLIKTKVEEIGIILNKVGQSVTGMAKNLFGDNDQDQVSDDLGDDFKNKKQTRPQQKNNNEYKNSGKSSQDELLELSNILNFNVAYTDFSENDKHMSLLSLYTNPEYTCFGESKTELKARNAAAENGLNLLSKMGIYDLFLEQQKNPLERKTKEGVKVVLDQVILKKKEEL